MNKVEKCNILNYEKGEFLIWFLLGLGIASEFWLIVFIVPESKAWIVLAKDLIEPISTIIIALISVRLVVCQLKQEQSLQVQTNTLQLVDSLLNTHFERIDSQIESINNEDFSNHKKVKEEIPVDTQYNNIGTKDVEPNDNYAEAETQKQEISQYKNKKVDKVLDDFFKFIYDIEVKIENNIVDEYLIKIYFKDKIEEIFTQKIMTKFFLEEDMENIILVNDYKKEKIVTLSKRWYDGKNYIEIKELLKD